MRRQKATNFSIPREQGLRILLQLTKAALKYSINHTKVVNNKISSSACEDNRIHVLSIYVINAVMSKYKFMMNNPIKYKNETDSIL